MEVEVSKLGFMAFGIAFVPFLLTIFGIGLVGVVVYRMPWMISMEIGAFQNGLSPSVAVPLMIKLIETGVGT